MTKPSWTPAAFRLRVRQASKPMLFLVVEGKETDPVFYDAIARSSEAVTEFGFVIYPVEYVTRGTSQWGGGKPQVVGLYEHLRDKRELSPRSREGGTKKVMMLLDADHDVTAGRHIRSKHVTYTDCADAESELLAHIDLSRLIAAVCSVGTDVANSKMSDLLALPAMLATEWRPWMELCMCREIVRVSGPRLGTQPPQSGPGGTLDVSKVAAVSASIESRCTNARRLAAARRNARRRVGKYFVAAESHKLLKGKWLASVMTSQLDAWALSNGYGRVVNRDVLLATVRALANYMDPHFDYYIGSDSKR